MAAHLGHGQARKSNNHKFCHAIDLLNWCWLSHSIDQQGELPLMEDLFSWNEGRHLSIMMALDGQAMIKQKQVPSENILACNQGNYRRRSHGTAKQMEAGALKTGSRKNVLHHSLVHTARESSRLKVGCNFQADCYQLEHPPANHTRDNKGVLTDDDFSLHHWLNSGCNQKDARMSDFQGRTETIDARDSRSSKLTRPRIVLSPDMHVCELFHRQGMKKRKLATSSENCQNVKAFWQLMSNPHSKNFHHHSLTRKVRQPMLVRKEHASKVNRADAHKFIYGPQSQLPFVTEHITKLKSRDLHSKLSKATLIALRNMKLPFFDDELNVPEQPVGGKCKSWRKSSGNRQRKALPNSSRKRHFSDLSVRNRGPSRAVNVKAKSNSKHGSMLQVPIMKETEAMFVPVGSLACRSENYTLEGGGSVKDVHGSSVKLAANRQTLKKGSRNSAMEDHGHFNSPPLRSKVQSLSHKYRPKMLQDLIGQSLVAHALSNAILKDKVAPVYLFQGSHGTGKTSAARIFAMALNCINSEERKPCGLCNECTALISGNASYVWELDAASYNETGLMHELIESIGLATPGPRYRVIIIDECHIFSNETWSALMRVFEELPSNAVFILITTEPENLPHSITSRCQKYHFLQIKHSDIVNRLDHIAKLENIFTEPGALSLIASKSDGSLRSAETILDQVSLLEQRITLATVHKLVGSVSDDKLIRLLDLALCSDMVRTVQKTREIVDFGVDPLDLLSQLATLITDILAGSYLPVGSTKKEGFSMHALSDLEMDRLRTALVILSEAERQVRAVSLCRTTWLIAALLQLGPRLQQKSEATISSKSPAKASPATPLTVRRARGIKIRVCDKGREISKRSMSLEMVLGEKGHRFGALDTDKFKLECESSVDSSNILDPPRKLSFSTLEESSSIANEDIHIHFRSPSNVGRLWLNVLKCCRPLSVRHLLQNHGKLLALTFSAVNIVAHIMLEKPAEKITAEMYHACIANSFKKVLGPSVEVKFSLTSDLQGAGCASCHATIADAACFKGIFKHSECCKVCERQIEKESFDAKCSSNPSGPPTVVSPVKNRPSCLPLYQCSPHSFCRTETTIFKEHRAKNSIPLARGPTLMQCSADYCSKDFGRSDDFEDLYFKKQSRRHCWGLSVGSHAKKLIWACVP